MSRGGFGPVRNLEYYLVGMELLYMIVWFRDLANNDNIVDSGLHDSGSKHDYEVNLIAGDNSRLSHDLFKGLSSDDQSNCTGDWHHHIT